MQRYRNMQNNGPSAEDIEALPSRALAQTESLIPYTKQEAGTVSDRGLRRGADATVFNGINLYRQSDNAPLSSIPQGITTGSVSAGNHIFSINPFPQQAPRLRADSNGVLGLRTEGRFDGVYAGDVNDTASTLGFRGASTLGQYAIRDNSVFANNGNGRVAGTLFSAARAFSSRTVNTAILLMKSDYEGGTESEAVVDAASAGLSTNPLNIRFQGVRVRARDALKLAGSRNMDTLFADYHFRLGKTRLMLGTSANPSVQYEARVERSLNSTTSFSVHYEEYPQSSPVIQTIIPPRARLIEGSFDIGDNRRARGQVTAYQESTADLAQTMVRGFGATASYQIAPRISLRSWLLRATQSEREKENPLAPYYLDRSQHENAQLLWLTYDNGIRFDLLFQERRPELSGYFRLGTRASLVAGSRISDSHYAFTIEYVSR